MSKRFPSLPGWGGYAEAGIVPFADPDGSNKFELVFVCTSEDGVDLDIPTARAFAAEILRLCDEVEEA